MSITYLGANNMFVGSAGLMISIAKGFLNEFAWSMSDSILLMRGPISSFILKVWYFVSNYIMNHNLASKLEWEGEKERLKCVESSALKPFLKEKKCFCLTLICRKPESWTIIVKLLICPYILDTIASNRVRHLLFCNRLNEKRIPR